MYIYYALKTYLSKTIELGAIKHFFNTSDAAKKYFLNNIVFFIVTFLIPFKFTKIAHHINQL